MLESTPADQRRPEVEEKRFNKVPGEFLAEISTEQKGGTSISVSGIRRVREVGCSSTRAGLGVLPSARRGGRPKPTT